MVICMQKATSSLTSFLRYCKVIADLLFWELWECLTISIKIFESLMLICMQNINFTLQVFLEILQQYCKFVTLSTLGIAGYAHPN